MLLKKIKIFCIRTNYGYYLKIYYINIIYYILYTPMNKNHGKKINEEKNKSKHKSLIKLLLMPNTYFVFLILLEHVT